MARRQLDVTRYEAEMVLIPTERGTRQVVRVIVFGPNFPERAVLPEILVDDLCAEEVSISRDLKSIRGYFSEVPKDGARIVVRYGDSQEGIVSEPFAHKYVRPLPTECA